MSGITETAKEFIKQTQAEAELQILLNDNTIQYIKEIKKLKKGKISLVFGAGISIEPFGLPSWNNLLKQATISRLNNYVDCSKKQKFKDFIEENGLLIKESEDLYEWAQYLENWLADDLIYKRKAMNTFYTNEQVCRHVYNAVKYSLFFKAKDKHEIENELSINDEYIISNLCAFTAKYKIERIITYNYDDAFEFAYKKYANENKCNPIYPIFIDNQLENRVDNSKILHIYHVHGFIKYFTEWAETDIDIHLNKSKAKQLVLTENDYDGIAQTSYKWRNTIQGDTFLRYNCLFFGFSASDKNFKRILKLIGNNDEGEKKDKKVGPAHYLFLRVDDIIDQIFPIKDNEKQTLELICCDENLCYKINLLTLMMRDKSRYFETYNIKTIWFFDTDRKAIMKELLSV